MKQKKIAGKINKDLQKWKKRENLQVQIKMEWKIGANENSFNLLEGVSLSFFHTHPFHPQSSIEVIAILFAFLSDFCVLLQFFKGKCIMRESYLFVYVPESPSSNLSN